MWLSLALAFQSLHASLAEQFKQTGYVELCDAQNGAQAFDALYACFDEFIEFLQTHPVWVQKLYSAKERFIRSKERHYYATDFFGLYDDSEIKGRNQIAFYYATHFHDFIYAQYPEFKNIPEIMRFFDACAEIEKSYIHIFETAAAELGLPMLFASQYNRPPILFKVMKYFPGYIAGRPHYDGSAFSLLLDSTDNQSLLLTPYKTSLCVDDFSAPLRIFPRESNSNSALLIPGSFLKEFSINPTPHIVMQSGKVRYATIAFAMRPHYVSQKNDFSLLPNFNR